MGGSSVATSTTNTWFADARASEPTNASRPPGDHAGFVSATITAPLSTVGAGDCMLAGLLHGLSTGLDPADALVTGVTWGAAAVTLPGSRVPAPSDLDGIRAELTRHPDLALALT